MKLAEKLAELTSLELRGNHFSVRVISNGRCIVISDNAGHALLRAQTASAFSHRIDDLRRDLANLEIEFKTKYAEELPDEDDDDIQWEG